MASNELVTWDVQVFDWLSDMVKLGYEDVLTLSAKTDTVTKSPVETPVRVTDKDVAIMLDVALPF